MSLFKMIVDCIYFQKVYYKSAARSITATTPLLTITFLSLQGGRGRCRLQCRPVCHRSRFPSIFSENFTRSAEPEQPSTARAPPPGRCLGRLQVGRYGLAGGPSPAVSPPPSTPRHSASPVTSAPSLQPSLGTSSLCTVTSTPFTLDTS